MNYMTNFTPRLTPFTVVSAPYVDLEGQIKTFADGTPQRGLFMIARVDDDGNVLAFKITSQRSKFINEYTYLINSYTHPFLKADSYVQLDKWHTLRSSECFVIGIINPSLRMALLRRFDAITREVDKCLKDNMSWHNSRPRYVSPNVKEEVYSD